MAELEESGAHSISGQGDENFWRASEIDKATDCMRKLGYSRLGFITEPGAPAQEVAQEFSWAMLAGLGMDDTLSELSRRQIVGLPMKDAAAYYEHSLKVTYEELSKKGTVVGSDTFSNVLAEGVAILGIYQRDFVPVINPVAVQKVGSFTLSTGSKNQDGTESRDVTVVGHIDLIRKSGDTQVISDWKFTKKTPAQMQAKAYLRGHAYDLMAGDGSGQIELILLRRGLKTPKIETTSYFVTKADHAAVKRQVSVVTEMYRKRYFPMASPTNWTCSEQWCGFWSICRGSKLDSGPARIPGEQELAQ